jgi:hypothetical protein
MSCGGAPRCWRKANPCVACAGLPGAKSRRLLNFLNPLQAQMASKQHEKSTAARLWRVGTRDGNGTGTENFGGGCLMWKPQVFARSNMRLRVLVGTPASSIEHGKPLSSWPA